MANLIDTAAGWLAERMKDHAGTAVTFQRGQQSVLLTGTRLLREYQIMDESGFTSNVQMHDWTFTTADVVLGGTVITPRPGDLLTIGNGAGQERYEVLPLGDEPAAVPYDANANILLVHTKRVR